MDSIRLYLEDVNDLKKKRQKLPALQLSQNQKKTIE